MSIVYNTMNWLGFMLVLMKEQFIIETIHSENFDSNLCVISKEQNAFMKVLKVMIEATIFGHNNVHNTFGKIVLNKIFV